MRIMYQKPRQNTFFSGIKYGLMGGLHGVTWCSTCHYMVSPSQPYSSSDDSLKPWIAMHGVMLIMVFLSNQQPHVIKANGTLTWTMISHCLCSNFNGSRQTMWVAITSWHACLCHGSIISNLNLIWVHFKGLIDSSRFTNNSMDDGFCSFCK